jgi:hypothetical protein
MAYLVRRAFQAIVTRAKTHTGCFRLATELAEYSQETFICLKVLLYPIRDSE